MFIGIVLFKTQYHFDDVQKIALSFITEIQNGEMSSTTEELIQDDDQNTSEAGKPQIPNGQTKKRWKVWREKIQGFIKKLFA